MSGRGEPVPRPRRKVEYVIVFGTNDAKKSWADLNAVARNSLVDAWEFLTTSPREPVAGRCYQLEGDFATVKRNGAAYDQWQLKLPGGARIWYYVTAPSDGKSAGDVVLVRVSTHHPNETK